MATSLHPTKTVSIKPLAVASPAVAPAVTVLEVRYDPGTRRLHVIRSDGIVQSYDTLDSAADLIASAEDTLGAFAANLFRLRAR